MCSFVLHTCLPDEFNPYLQSSTLALIQLHALEGVLSEHESSEGFWSSLLSSTLSLWRQSISDWGLLLFFVGCMAEFPITLRVAIILRPRLPSLALWGELILVSVGATSWNCWPYCALQSKRFELNKCGSACQLTKSNKLFL